MNKKLISAMLCATMAAGMLAGCGSSSGSSSASSVASATADTAASTEAAADTASTQAAGTTADSSQMTIGISMPTKSLERWNRDGSYLKEQFESKGYNVELTYSDNKSAQRTMISRV